LKAKATMSVVTTLSFGGRTEEAVEHYRTALDAHVLMLMRFRECPDPSMVQPGWEDKIFHATFRIGTTELMASDMGGDAPDFEMDFAGFAFAVRDDSIEDAERHFAALSEHGRVLLPLAPTFFATRYGIVIDRFGVSWKITVPGDAD
jgi:PhnB protein